MPEKEREERQWISLVWKSNVLNCRSISKKKASCDCSDCSTLSLINNCINHSRTYIYIYIYIQVPPVGSESGSDMILPPAACSATVFTCRTNIFLYPVDWGCKIHRLHLCRGVRPPTPNECPRYDTKWSDGEVPMMLELWGMQSAPSLPLLPGPLWPGVVALDRALSMV